MTPRTRHAAYTARAAADLSRVTDRQTDAAHIGNNSLHLIRWTQPNNYVSVGYILAKRPRAGINEYRTCDDDYLGRNGEFCATGADVVYCATVQA